MEILEILLPGKAVSGETIARRLKLSRAAVHKRILKLRAQGYVIDGERNVGYRLVNRPDRILPEEVRRQLAERGVAARDVRCLETVGSTQIAAKELAENGAAEWTTVVAERQTGSYGRLGRVWTATEGGLWFSFILRPRLSPEAVPPLTLVASLAMCRAIEREYDIRTAIKWPNDLMLDGKKVAGILTEMSAEIGRVNWVVIGIGLNVNNPVPRGLTDVAAPLGRSFGKPLDRCRLLAAFLREMGMLYALFQQQGFGTFAHEYNVRSLLRGKDISLSAGGRSITGRVVQIDGDGYLRLKTRSGRNERIVIGDVTLRKRRGGTGS
jgi:BirA family biotin operon repressor/biotin-[acetyl-CoA-carboxylase] ligase